MSATGTPGFSRTWASSLSAWALSACSDLADSTHGTTAGPFPADAGTASGAGSSNGACSMTTCALVPLTPKEETPARRGAPVSGHGVSSDGRASSPADQSTCSEGRSMCRVGGIAPCWRAITVLTRPAAPAAAWVWPMLDLTEPSQSGRPSGRLLPNTACSAWASIGSPSLVPVPCASTMSICAVDRPASSRAARMTLCCAGPLGAVRPLDAPSWFIADPRITASTRRPALRASERRSTRNMPTPSPQPVPSASAENALQRPLVESPRWRLNSVNAPALAMTVTPPTMAMEHSSLRSDWQARWSATREEEQAVSTVTAGPLRPKL